MGIYNTFMSKDGKTYVQLKVGDLHMGIYRPGDPCHNAKMPNGVYEGHEGFVAILAQHVFSVTKTRPKYKVLADLPRYTKWGDVLEPSKTLADYDEVAKTVAKIEKKHAKPSKLPAKPGPLCIFKDCPRPTVPPGRFCNVHGCAVCGGIILADTDAWPVQFCHKCLPGESPHGIIMARCEKLVRAAYEKGRRDIIGDIEEKEGE